MSFYNLMFGKNPNTKLILALIGLKECDIERFRDCWIDWDNEQIVILTRTGGYNRSDYPNELLTKNPYHLYNEDDSFDNTYAYYCFKFPDEIKQDIYGLKEPEKYGISANLIKWINKTLNRSKTEKDIKFEKIQQEEKIIKNLVYNSYIQIWNGWAVVPLSDQGFEGLCKLAEKNDGKLFMYIIKPYKPKVITYGYKYKTDEKKDIDMYSACITQPDKWEIDEIMWNRWKEKYKKKYPKTITQIENDIKKEDK